MRKTGGKGRRKKRRVNPAVILLPVLIASTIFFYPRIRAASEIMKIEDSGCPESLIELAKINPETIDFVKGYSSYDENAGEADISEDVKKGEIPLFLQWDERWGYEKYGSDFMAITGCGPTCLSMVYSGLTGNTDMNPFMMAVKAEDEGYYVDGSGSSWSMMDEMARELGLEVFTPEFSKEGITDTLNKGLPVICIMGPGDFTSAGHFIVLTGNTLTGKIKVNDPNSRKNSNKSWEVERLMPQIRNLWAYSFEGEK